MLSISDYNYPLPDERIAKYPLPERDHSKLLVWRNGQVEEDRFFHIGDYIPEGSLLIYNNTRVIRARMEFHKSTGARVEVFCLEPLSPHDYQLSLTSTTGCSWKCLIGNAKKVHDEPVSLTLTLPESGRQVVLQARKGAVLGNAYEVHFSWSDATVSFAEILDAAGELPIPPYLNRKTEASDLTTYQTVYSRIKGSVAAPTAGLHFTDAVLTDLRSRGIETAEVTLHVGAGTFLPVKTEDANAHVMHTEIIAVDRATICSLIRRVGHIVAVGTTSMRTLESLYYMGCQLAEGRLPEEDGYMHVGQFEPYDRTYSLSTAEALQAIVDYLDATHREVLHGETQIMIKPGYTFRVVCQLITNFHQPKSTLLLLVSAFVGGEHWREIYDYALAHDFRFLSYGDSSILFQS